MWEIDFAEIDCRLSFASERTGSLTGALGESLKTISERRARLCLPATKPTAFG
jgi:hypothetical protein